MRRLAGILLLCVISLSAAGMGRWHPGAAAGTAEPDGFRTEAITLEIPEHVMVMTAPARSAGACCGCDSREGGVPLVPAETSGVLLKIPGDILPTGPTLSPPPEPPRS